MEEWERLLENYNININSKTFSTTIHTAKCALDEDLAPFESDWIFSTLIKKPVNLLELVGERRMTDEYSKCIVEALKLLGDAVDKYDNFEKYYEQVSQLCLLQYSAVPRQHALSCLTRVARRASCASRGLRDHVAALQRGVCMAPLAVLIGTICEYHPHVAADDVINIWRVFLNLLDSNKYSGAVTKAVLQGILGLFKHFGDDLPSMELITFYDRLMAFLEMSSCQEVCLAILTHHARLFFTCVNRDAAVRALLWRLNAFEALQAVYAECDPAVLQEVKAYTSSSLPRVRGMARRLLGGEGAAEEHQLEASLRNGGGGEELGEQISWSIRTNTQCNHRLLQAAMLFYDSIPTNTRRDILLAIMNSPTDIVNAAITFLIAEISRNQKLTIWQDILKCDAEKLKLVYHNINKYINTIVEGVAEGSEGPPLSSLLPLLLSLPPIACVQCSERATREACDTTSLLMSFSGGQNIPIDDCAEDEVKIKCSLIVLYGIDERTYPLRTSLAALQTIFSTKNLEAVVLSKALNALEVVVRDHNVDECVLSEIIHNLEKIRKRTDKTKKADRILYRDIFMFIGKNRKIVYIDNDLNSLIVELKNNLSIQIPHETGTLKVSLSGVLYSALHLEDEDALNVLLSVVIANLSSSRALSLQRVLIRVCVCLSHTNTRTHIQQALRVCDPQCALELLQYIMKEKSSESRKILLEGLEILIKKDTDGRVLENIVENIIYVEDTNSPSYIHTLDTINNLLKDNNSVCLKLLPDFLIKVLKTPKSDHVLMKTYKLFLDKMFIYDDLTLNKFITDIIKKLNARKNMTINNITLDFVKNILYKTNKKITEYIEIALELKVFVSMKRCFDFDVTLNSLVLDQVREKLFDISHDLESILMFLESFLDILLEREYEKTISLLCQIIVSLTLEDIRDNSKSLVNCMKSLKTHLQIIPQTIINRIQNYIKKINIDKLSESVENNGFTSDNELKIHAVKVMIEALDGPVLSDFDDFIDTWKSMFHKLYDSGYVKICLESKIDVLSDFTFVALNFMNEEEIKCIILRGPDNFGLTFTSSLMSVFFPHMSVSLLTHCSTLLHHVLTHAKRGRGEVEDLIDQIWPYYERVTTFRQKQLFLLDYLPHSRVDSEPVKWLTSILSNDTEIQNKLMILDVLPKGDIYGPLPLLLLPLLPTRLSELEGISSDCFRAILDALATNTHTSVLEAVATLAANDPTAGWWDSALEACMSRVSRSEAGAERRVWDACAKAGHGAFRRLMIPLLRYSKPSVIESFVSPILEELLSTLRRTPRGDSCPRGVERHLMEQVRAFNVLEIVFQRVPREHVESPRSSLYRHTSAEAPYHLVTAACKLCVALRRGGGTHGPWLVANYNCLTWALLCRRPRPALYATLLEPEVWGALLEHPDEPQTCSVQRVTRQCVSRQAAGLSSVRSRVFLRTLSENPLAYDLKEEEEDEIIIEDIQLPDSPLNAHPCMPTLTALLTTVGGEGGEGGGDVVKEGVLKALKGEKSLAEFFAQAVCNAREALKRHSGSLTPALFALVVGRVNDLHLHVLNTIIYWGAELTENVNINKAIESIIVTAIENGRTDSLYRMLVDKLNKLLHIYGTIVSIPWSCIEKYFKDPKSQNFEMCLRILNRINIYIPELLPAVSLHLERRMTLLWSVYGKALRAAHERGGGEREVKRYRSVLESFRRSDSAEYIRALYYVQKEHPPACDTTHYRSIADLVPKIPRRERPKCLSILSTYIEWSGEAHSMLETLDLLEEMDTVQGLELATVSLPLMSPPLRALVCASAGARLGRSGLTGAAYKLLLRDFELRTHIEPSIKRRTLAPHPHIYTAVGVARWLKLAREGVKGLSSDLGVRFCECFILCVVVPLTHDLNANMPAILDLFFQEIKQHEVFKNAKLSEHALEFRTPSNETLTGNEQNTDNISEINIQMSIEDVLNSIIKFARKDDRVCTSIIVQLIKALGAIRPGFDLQETISKDIVNCIKISSVADSVLEIARQTDIWGRVGLDEVTHLVQCTRNSEGEEASRALYEEVLVRKRKEFVLGSNNAKEEEMPEVSEKFSMKDLISTFGKLSNWENITRYERTHTSLPPLWTDRQTLERSLDKYDFEDSPLWLRAMVSKYKGEEIHTYKVLKDLDQWPRRHFDIAAVLESQACEVSVSAQTHIHRSDCMAQWAARIMVGSLYAGSSYLPSRSLAWCEKGNEMGLYEQVVECCRSGILTEESGSFNLMCQEIMALRGMALERQDGESLRKLLIRAESYNPLETKSNFVDMLGINELTLRLRHDINLLEKVHVESVITYMKQNVTCSFKTENISTICVLGMTHYDKAFAASTDVQEQSSLLLSMCELLGLHGSLSLPWSPLMSDVLLQALDYYQGEILDEDVADVILNTLHPMIHNLDECSINQLKSNRHRFPEHGMLRELHENELSLQKYKQCLSLICDPTYVLQQYCRQLIHHVESGDERLYKETLMKMKQQVFENPYSGPDYRVLLKYLSTFNEISDFATDRQAIKQVLIKIHSELVSRRDTLYLSDVCPTLSRERESESLSRLLGLRRGLRVVKFEEKMLVFSSSVCRPVLVSFVSSSGVVGRCIVKREGPGGGHAAVARARGATGDPGRGPRGYEVTALSEECVLIEHLERHMALRALLTSDGAPYLNISSACPTESPCMSLMPPDVARSVFASRCESVPAYALRSAIETRCATFQDFLYKKKNFQESVCWMTILNFLFGVSDRHLENILYSEESGGACDVDVGDLTPGDLPPARLTRNILAVCHLTELEGSLQRKLSKIREHQGIILPSIKMSFKNTDKKYRDKVRFIQGKIQGSLLAHQVSRETILDSSLQYRDKYILLLEQIFGTDTKPEYSVEEQISSLLVQCTDPRILSVTRTGWEPWI